MDRYRSRGLAGPAGVALLVALFLSALLAPAAAWAQEPSWVTFGPAEHEVTFGRAVTFGITADVSRPPTEVWLVYRLEGERAENAALAEHQGDRTVTAQWLWELQSGDLPPGAVLTYYWVFESADGQTAQSPESSLEYEDSRFDWSVQEGGILRVHSYRNPDLARTVLDAGLEALARLDEQVGVESRDPIRVYVYASERDMAAAISSRSEAFDARTVTLGMAMGGNTLVLLGRSSDLVGTVAHELSHIVVGRVTDGPFSRLPRWLDEGLAMYAEGALPAGNRRALDQAIRNDSVISLRSMTSYPGDAGLVDLFYGEAYSIVEFLAERDGPEAMRRLLVLIGEGRTIEEALVESHGLTPDELERGWRESVGLPAERRQPAAAAATPTAGVSGQLRNQPGPTQVLPCASALVLPAAAVLAIRRRRAA